MTKQVESGFQIGNEGLVVEITPAMIEAGKRALGRAPVSADVFDAAEPDTEVCRGPLHRTKTLRMTQWRAILRLPSERSARPASD